MKSIAAGFGQVVNAGARGTAELRGIAVADDGRLLHFVLAQHHSQRSAIVRVL